MFEQRLKKLLKEIFDLEVRLEAPGESEEQGIMFANVERSRNKILDGRFSAQVSGQLVVFSELEKLPFGYFDKAIAQAKPESVKPFFFHEIDANVQTIQNVVRRSLRFVFFYDAQYDPDLGTITQVVFQEGEAQ